MPSVKVDRQQVLCQYRLGDYEPALNQSCLYASFLKGQGHHRIFSLVVKGTLLEISAGRAFQVPKGQLQEGMEAINFEVSSSDLVILVHSP